MIRKLSRGFVWGAMLSGVAAFAIIALFPMLNSVVLWAIAAAAVVCIGLGITLNLRAVTVSCSKGHTFTALTDSSQCPDCGQKYAEIKRAARGGNVA